MMVRLMRLSLPCSTQFEKTRWIVFAAPWRRPSASVFFSAARIAPSRSSTANAAAFELPPAPTSAPCLPPISLEMPGSTIPPGWARRPPGALPSSPNPLNPPPAPVPIVSLLSPRERWSYWSSENESPPSSAPPPPPTGEPPPPLERWPADLPPN